MKLLLEEALEVANAVWLTFVPPHQLAMLGPSKLTQGRRSILLASSVTFDKERAHLMIDPSHITVLNVGTTPSALIVLGDGDIEDLPDEHRETDNQTLGPGDREFLGLVEREFDAEARQMGQKLLQEVRKQYPGDLKRGQRNNFSNTPDNFWYVIVQPRIQALSITVRGAPDRFDSPLELKMDRPGYTRFQITREADVPDAMRVISQSLKKTTRQV